MNKKFKIAIGLSAGVLVTTPIILFTHNSCSKPTRTHTNIENEAQQYANDNSISLGFMFQPNTREILNQTSKFFLSNNTITPTLENAIYKELEYNMIKNAGYSSLLFGTSWLIDYKPGIRNMHTYYLATNTHVLDLTVTLKGQLKFNSKDYQYEFAFPVNENNVNDLRLFLSQPQGQSDNNNGSDALYNRFTTDWYETGITKENIGNSIIQYANKKQNNDYINFSFSLIENGTLIGDLLVKENNTTTTINQQITTNASNYGIDTSILKLQINPDFIKPKLGTSPEAKIQLQKLRKIFDITQNYSDNTSTYIAKLKKTYSDLEADNGVNNYTNSEYFPFQLSRNKVSMPITVGGFPGNNREGYTYFNTATTQTLEYNKKIKRDYIRVLIDNKFIYLKYKTKSTGYLAGVNLMPGSSGSMVLDNDMRIIGIYWGSFVDGSYGLFVPFDSSWINFIKTNNEFKDSKLGQLLNYKKN